MFRGRVDKNFGGDWKIGEVSILDRLLWKAKYGCFGNDGKTEGMRINQTKYVEKKLAYTDVHLQGDELLSSFRTSMGTSMCATVNSQFQDVESCRADEQGYHPHQGRYLRCRYV